MNKSTKGALLASAVATLFLATAAMAQEGAPSPSPEPGRSDEVRGRERVQGSECLQERAE